MAKMRMYHATTARKGVRYAAVLHTWEDGNAAEYVTRFDDMGGRLIHEAEFPMSNLGSASRNEYTRVMLASVADADQHGRQMEM